MDDEKTLLEGRALAQARELGHRIPQIVWEAPASEGIDTCTRCGDGVLLYVGADGSSIQGTAYSFECPSNTCDHGWQILRAPAGGVLLRCLHCGAERTEEEGG